MTGDPLRIHDPAALTHFREELEIFAARAHETLAHIDASVHKTLSILATRQDNWLRALEERQAALEYADDETREEAWSALGEAEEAIRTLRQQQAEVDAAVAHYRRALAQVQALLDQDSPKAVGALRQHVELLADYQAVQLPDLMGAPGSGRSGGGALGGAGKTPSISGFSDSPLGDDAAVERYLTELIPAAHRGTATLRGIRYVDEFRREPSGVLLGYTTPDAGGFATIDILRHSETGQVAPAYLETTLAHEIGHHVHLYVLDGKDWHEWQRLHTRSSFPEYVSDYARSSAEEDFSESYAWYIHNPFALAKASPDKYAFMRDSVFAGREYAT
jgi:tetratricopeptide (TPR) repeat protein